MKRRFLLAGSSALPFSSSAVQAQKPRLATKTFVFEEMPAKQNGVNVSRAILDGETHTGYPLEIHMTELAPGQAPHGSHRHPNDEMVIVHDGTIELNVEGNTTRLTRGSVAYVNSGENHGLRNAGEGRCRYYIVALGSKK